ncbi:MAG TPA: potassium/proton antiporter [Burkholderiaceae bacterium]
MHTLNLLMLAGGLLVFTSLLAGVLSARLGLPFLLVFLIAGMLTGVDGPLGVTFDSVPIAAAIGNVALALILLEGGASTRMQTFRRGAWPGVLLATVGVLVTAGLVAAVAMWALKLDWHYGLLLGAIVGSTDAAAVFSTLRQTGVRLHDKVTATLEIESGLNDPMAVFLTLALTATIQAHAGVREVALLFAAQAVFGTAIGLAGASAVAWLLRKLTLPVEQGGIASLIIVSGGFAVYAASGLLDGSGFLAIYLYGLRLRDSAEQVMHAASSALDGFAWAAQATLFLLLGLLVTPHELLGSLNATIAIAATLMLVARPVAVWLCLAPLGFKSRQIGFIAWVGLRGAVPIVLALVPLMRGVPGSPYFFNVTFAVVLASLLLQGTTLGRAAKALKVDEPPPQAPLDQRPVHGRLTLDAELPLADVFEFFQLPMPEQAQAVSLREWMVDSLARDLREGDGIDWHGARFEVGTLRDGQIARVRLQLASRAKVANA